MKLISIKSGMRFWILLNQDSFFFVDLVNVYELL